MVCLNLGVLRVLSCFFSVESYTKYLSQYMLCARAMEHKIMHFLLVILGQ